MTVTVFDNIDTVEKAQELRLIRNECAGWMTKNTNQISQEQQREFFREKISTGLIEGFLVRDDNGNAVAYGLLVWDDEGRVWSSNGTKVSERGHGYGRTATVEIARRAHAQGVPIWAEVRHDNTGEQKICATIGYEILDTFERDGLVIDVMRCDKLEES